MDQLFRVHSVKSEIVSSLKQIWKIMNEVVNTQAGLKAFKLNQSASGHFDFDLSVIEEKNKATFVSWIFQHERPARLFPR